MQPICFRLERAAGVDEDDRACTRAWVTAVLYGRELGARESPIQFWDLLAYRGLDAEFELLTCSCGEAECAGFHDRCYQYWGPVVAWTFNAGEYGSRLSGFNPDEDRPQHLRVLLDPGQLNAALDDLVRQLQDALVTGPLLLSPGFDDDPLTDIAQLHEGVARQRAWYVEQVECERRRREVFGPLHGMQVQAQFANGALLEADLGDLLRDILVQEAEEHHVEPGEERDAYICQQVATFWRPSFETQGPGALLALVHRQAWADVEHRFRTLRRADNRGTLRGTLQTRWQAARLQLCKQAQ